MYKCINGFTKEKIKETIIKNNFNRISMYKNDSYSVCHYKSNDGNKCFVGCFIPEEEYLEKIEGKSVTDLLELFPNLNQYMPLQTSALISLQILHDNYSSFNAKSLHEVMIEWVDANVED